MGKKKKTITMEQLLKSYLRLIDHLVARRQFPQEDLDRVLEPINEHIEAAAPTLRFYAEEEKE